MQFSVLRKKMKVIGQQIDFEENGSQKFEKKTGNVDCTLKQQFMAQPKKCHQV